MKNFVIYCTKVGLSLLFAVGLGWLVPGSMAADIVPSVGTLSTGGSAVAGFATDVQALLEFLAMAALALTIVSVLIAIGWKVYRFFRPAR